LKVSENVKIAMQCFEIFRGVNAPNGCAPGCLYTRLKTSYDCCVTELTSGSLKSLNYHRVKNLIVSHEATAL